jgi:hypothetical protein
MRSDTLKARLLPQKHLLLLNLPSMPILHNRHNPLDPVNIPTPMPNSRPTNSPISPPTPPTAWTRSSTPPCVNI